MKSIINPRNRYTEPDDIVMADPMEVDRLIKVLGEALNENILQGVTTQADLLSALFTVLHRALKESRAQDEPEFQEKNAKEISRVLTEFLVEFGYSGLPN